jgi:hypothetical protein
MFRGVVISIQGQGTKENALTWRRGRLENAACE